MIKEVSIGRKAALKLGDDWEHIEVFITVDLTECKDKKKEIQDLRKLTKDILANEVSEIMESACNQR